MENYRCCPTDPNMKDEWEKELQKDLESLEKTNMDEIAELLKVLSNSSRLKMVMLLSKRDYCVCEFVTILGEKQSLISYNLGILKKQGLVESYNRSRDKYCKLDERALSMVRCLKQNLIIGF